MLSTKMGVFVDSMQFFPSPSIKSGFSMDKDVVIIGIYQILILS